MSSFTDHTEITPHEEWIWNWKNNKQFWFWSDLFFGWKKIEIIVPEWYIFDGASVPGFWLRSIGVFFIQIWWIFTAIFFFLCAALIQKVQTDTIASAGIHDRWYTHYRRIWRIRLDLLFLEALIVYNIPKFLEKKKFLLAFVKIMQYIWMTVVLLLLSWIVWYKIPKRISNFVKSFYLFLKEL